MVSTAAAGRRHHYVVVADDVQKNASVSAVYSWRLNLAYDLSAANVTISGNDALFTDTSSPGHRRLLVRMLDHGGGGGGSGTPFTWEVQSYNITALTNGTVKAKDLVHVLAGNTTATSASFRVLLFPLAGTDATPTTTWHADGTARIVMPGGGVDTLHFAPHSAAEPFTVVSVTHE